MLNIRNKLIIYKLFIQSSQGLQLLGSFLKIQLKIKYEKIRNISFILEE